MARQIQLAYGRHGLSIEVPDDAVIVSGRELPGLLDAQAIVANALISPLESPPLGRLARSKKRPVVVFPDQTRPMPHRVVLLPILSTLEDAGLKPEQIRLLCATGTHRAPTSTELEEMLGVDITKRYAVVSHDCRRSRHIDVGTVAGVRVEINAEFVESDLRIVTGFVEPHVFAGFSGGPKAVCPGLASMDTILEAHSPSRIASPDATWLRALGNPVHDFIRSAVQLCPPSFSVDLTLNSAKEVGALFVGSLWASHEAAMRFVRDFALHRVAGRFGSVITTNGGYPLDRNFYQCVKGLSAANRVADIGGTIVLAAECVDGLPLEGEFAQILAESRSVADLNNRDSLPRHDYWSAQVLGRILADNSVLVHTDGLSDLDLNVAKVGRIVDLQSYIDRCARSGQRICVIPQGPLTVPTADE